MLAMYARTWRNGRFESLRDEPVNTSRLRDDCELNNDGRNDD